MPSTKSTAPRCALNEPSRVTDPARRARFIDLASQGRQAEWPAQNRALLSAATRQRIGLETAATRLICYSPHTIPDLLQTPDYAAAVSHATQPSLHPRQTAELAAITTRRQAILHEHSRSFRFILDESALRRAIVPAPAMTAQLRQLALLAGTPNITIQAAPLSPAPPVLLPAFDLVTIPGQPHHIGIRQGNVTTRPAELRELSLAFTALARAALTPDETVSLINRLTGS